MGERSNLKRRSRGTPGIEPGSDDFICGYCSNSGIAETKQGSLIRCPCGAGVVKGNE